MTAEHYAEAELYDDGGGAYVRFICTGGDGDVCHQWCAEGCEEYCTARMIIPWPASAEPIAQAPAEGHRWEPTPRIGASSCRIVDWLDAVGWEESGWTEDDDQITVAQLRPGRHRIEEEWTGDDYIWRYPTEPAVTAAGVPT